MDGLLQRCLRLGSRQLRFRDCSEMVQTCEVEMQAQAGTFSGGRRVGDASEGLTPAAAGSGEAGG